MNRLKQDAIKEVLMELKDIQREYGKTIESLLGHKYFTLVTIAVWSTEQGTSGVVFGKGTAVEEKFIKATRDILGVTLAAQVLKDAYNKGKTIEELIGGSDGEQGRDR